MLNIKSIVHGANGAVDVELVFDLGKGPDTDQRSFLTVNDAIEYINSCKKTYIMTRLEKFVAHKKKISESSSEAFYRSDLRIKAFSQLQILMDGAPGQNLFMICRAVLKFNKYMVNILPVSNNSSYDSSVAELNDLMLFCLDNANFSN